MIVVLAEKPSVARELAQVLDARTRRGGYFEGNGYRVTWAIGHLLALPMPEHIEPAWKAWTRESLPMLPARWPLRAIESSEAQLRVVTQLLCQPQTRGVIAATDSGREGELIFRRIYEHAGAAAPVQRLWLSSMTHDAITAAFAKLEPSQRFDGLAAAAQARAQADWIVGMNFSRAYTLTRGALSSVGRVQTPTLAMVAARDEVIRGFVPQPYLEVEATFEGAAGSYKGTYYTAPLAELRDDKGRLRAFQVARARLPADGQLANAVAGRVRGAQARVVAAECQPKRTPPPLLYDLTELQRHANRLYGYTAQQTLEAAQTLYERHKVLSYPRTDSRHLSSAVAQTLPRIVNVLAERYVDRVAAGSGEPALGARFVDDAKVTEHHALIPTEMRASLAADSPEARIYDLVCRRLLMAWHDDLVEGVTRVLTEVASSAARDLFATSGTSVEAAGWTVLEPRMAADKEMRASKIPGGLVEGAIQRVTNVSVLRKQTQPPKPHTEATLLTAMEAAGKEVSDQELSAVMRDSGLGTPATRASIIEALIERGYLQRKGKALVATPDGASLVRAVHPLVRSPEMTGRWELRLRRIERSEEQAEPFLRELADYVRSVVADEARKPLPPRSHRGHRTCPPSSRAPREAANRVVKKGPKNARHA
jgi:DNA topoisomerase-3